MPKTDAEDTEPASVGGTGPELLAGQRVLVTGGRGFLAKHLCPGLRALGADVTVLVRRPPDAPDPNIRYHVADLADPAAARAAVGEARPDVVYLMASYGVGSPDLDHVLPCVANDFLATVNPLTAATELGCRRIVLAASMEEPQTPNAIPGSPYAAAKWAATGYARMFHDLYASPVVITRLFMTYGPGQRPHKLIPYVIRSLLGGQAPPLGSGERLVDWLYVDDAVQALLLAAVRPGIEGAELDIGSGHRISIRTVVERLVELIGSTEPVVFGGMAERPAREERRARVQPTLDILGWRAQTSLDEGLRRTVEFYRNGQ